MIYGSIFLYFVKIILHWEISTIKHITAIQSVSWEICFVIYNIQGGGSYKIMFI